MLGPNFVHWASIAGGWALIVAGLVIAPLPGPLGLPIMAVGGLVLTRRSRFFRRGVAALRRRFPALSDRIVRSSGKWPRAIRFMILKTDPRRVR